MLYDKKWDAKVEPKLEPWQKHLLDAAQYIRDHGWCQKALMDDEGRVCLLGALGKIPGDQAIPRQRLRSIIGINLVNWNNSPKRTKKEVIAALEEAAARQ